ncbi:hypothetical protein [Parabacteroides sp. An277]|uniref:hypothetical protein n=1 Tax=Parabacteroides sp. An277 TaxID=1965619 RepID=UPI001123DF7D|nr:hypothetical protein [Parabacteroides sp. An277]
MNIKEIGRFGTSPSGSLKEKPKGDNKKASPTKSIFCGTFLLPFGYLDRQKEGIDGLSRNLVGINLLV